MEKLYNYIYQKRFLFFFFTQLLVLFSSLIIPYRLYDVYFSPLFFIVNLTAGFFIVSKHRFLSIWIKIIIAILFLELLLSIGTNYQASWEMYLRFFSYFIFYAIVSFELIKQVWRSESMDSSIIIGLMSGYISLGLIGFFLFYFIDLFHPAAYQGIIENETFQYQSRGSQILYFSFVTLLTIGYGEIVPIIPIAQKAAILIGLMGQLYLVIITSIVVGKYLNQYNK